MSQGRAEISDGCAQLTTTLRRRPTRVNGDLGGSRRDDGAVNFPSGRISTAASTIAENLDDFRHVYLEMILTWAGFP
jgi:hypothetical protein